MTVRSMLGLSVGSGYETADAALVRISGVGLAMAPHVMTVARLPLPDDIQLAARKASRSDGPWPVDFDYRLAEILTLCARRVSGAESRNITAIGLIGTRIAECAESIAEQSGLTVVTGFSDRDKAAGGAGRPITPAADYLLFRDAAQDRTLVHLGTNFRVLFFPANSRVTDAVGFESGPGHRLLDDITSLGTRGREAFDRGGTMAVQGKCLEDLLAHWQSHPYLSRRPPKLIPRGGFSGPFVMDAFSRVRSVGGTLNDLLCTASRFAVGCVGEAIRAWLPTPRRILVSGGGVRNGYLWKLLSDEFPGVPLERIDALGVSAAARTAAGAAVLAALTLDGVSGNLPLLTNATGGRLLGRIIPGDQRNWARCVDWMARQCRDPLGRVA